MKNSPQTAARQAPETQGRSALDPAQLTVLDDEPAVDELGEKEDESAPKYKNMEENQTQRCDDVAAMMLERKRGAEKGSSLIFVICGKNAKSVMTPFLPPGGEPTRSATNGTAQIGMKRIPLHTPASRCRE